MTGRPSRAAKGDAFTRRKLAWLEKVVLHPGLSVTAYRLAVLLAVRYLNRVRGIAWPSVETLRSDLGANKTSVLRAIHSLEAGGLISVVHSRGRGNANEYRLLFPPEKGCADATISDVPKGCADATISEGKGGVCASEKVAPAQPQPFDEPSDGAGGVKRPPAPQPSEADDALIESEHPRAPSGARVSAPEPHIDKAAAELAALYGGHADHRSFAEDIVTGFVHGDDAAAEHVVELATARIIHRHEDRAARREAWQAFGAVARELLDAVGRPDAWAEMRNALRAEAARVQRELSETQAAELIEKDGTANG